MNNSIALRHTKAAQPLGWAYRPLAVGLSLSIALAAAVAFWFSWQTHTFVIFGDLGIYTDATRRLLTGDGWYLAMQQGTYPLAFGVVLYPPAAAWLFAPWLVLPAWTFTFVPVVALGAFVARLRPAPWTWPLITLGVVWPTTLLYVVYANPSLWIALFVALGLRYHWPAALVLLKPSLLPFALIGIRSWRWWATVGVIALASLPFLAETLAYPGVISRMTGADLTYSLGSVPLLLIPVVAWLGRSR